MKKLSRSFKTGIIALFFLVLGFECASFIGKVDVAVSDEGHSMNVESQQSGGGNRVPPEAVKKPEKPKKTVRTFDFNPNTATLEEFESLGFSPKQAASLVNYRNKGGVFHRKEDFARSFVVSDSVYRRLEKHIIIPLVDINAADSAAFDALPGIGPFYAARMVEYREKLHGYSYKEQLMDIWKFDREKYEGLCDLIEVGECEPYRIWSLPEDSLELHPYIGPYAAHGIVLYRENTPPEEWSVSNLEAAGVIKSENAVKLMKCNLE